MRDGGDAPGASGSHLRESIQALLSGGRILSHAVGQVDPDDNGVSGLELGLDTLVRGQRVRPSSCRFDMRVQYVLEHEMRETVRAFKAKAAGGIVLDVRTGEVLALASLAELRAQLRGPCCRATRSATA